VRSEPLRYEVLLCGIRSDDADVRSDDAAPEEDGDCSDDGVSFRLVTYRGALVPAALLRAGDGEEEYRLDGSPGKLRGRGTSGSVNSVFKRAIVELDGRKERDRGVHSVLCPEHGCGVSVRDKAAEERHFKASFGGGDVVDDGPKLFVVAN
jgi:hypothetical protein